MGLIFCIQVKFHKNCKLIAIFLVGVAGMPRHAQSLPKQQIFNISTVTYAILLIFCMQVKFYESYKLIVIFWVGVPKHAQTCPKYSVITNFQYLKNDFSYCFDFLQISKIPWNLQINCHILGGGDQEFRACPKCAKITNFQYLNNDLSYCFQL